MIDFIRAIFNEEFLNKWQTLVGSATGPFLAIILFAIGFWIRSKHIAYKERKNAIRQTEISMARSLNDMYQTREEVVYFIKRLKNTVESIRVINDDTTYMIEEINFPHLKDVFADNTLQILKFKSYYLHNKLLSTDVGINATNQLLKGLKETFMTIISNNKFLIALREKPRSQRNSYSENLDSFAGVIEKDVILSIQNVIKVLMQTKVYNLKLMKNHPFTIWKHEGRSFKYFRTMQKFRKYGGNLDVLDRLDKKFEKESEKLLEEAEDRGRRTNKKIS